ncbi:hypothetical protein ACFOED_09370 [Vulcaniibacterium thermophilum]|uniref:hypothetical protein n=1 Tax=Vulcaniibacterium thermophilum TaxID=1169913 RepID=UPI001648243E|nr:hypothetical protein [Vulcaniibacterium thermophilum]
MDATGGEGAFSIAGPARAVARDPTEGALRGSECGAGRRMAREAAMARLRAPLRDAPGRRAAAGRTHRCAPAAAGGGPAR